MLRRNAKHDAERGEEIVDELPGESTAEEFVQAPPPAGCRRRDQIGGSQNKMKQLASGLSVNQQCVVSGPWSRDRTRTPRFYASS